MEHLPIDCVQRITQYFQFPVSYFFQYFDQPPPIPFLFAKKHGTTFLFYNYFKFSNEHYSFKLYTPCIKMLAKYGALLHLVYVRDSHQELTHFLKLLQSNTIAKQCIKLKINLKNRIISSERIVTNLQLLNVNSLHLFFSSDHTNFAMALLLQCTNLKRFTGNLPMEQLLENKNAMKQMSQLQKLNCITKLSDTFLNILNSCKVKNLSCKHVHMQQYSSSLLKHTVQLSTYSNDTVGKDVKLTKQNQHLTHFRLFNSNLSVEENQIYHLQELFCLKSVLEYKSWKVFPFLSKLIVVNTKIDSLEELESLVHLYSLEYHFAELSLSLVQSLSKLLLKELYISTVKSDTNDTIAAAKALQTYLENTDTLSVLHLSVPHCDVVQVLQKNYHLTIVSVTPVSVLSNCEEMNSSVQMLIFEGAISWKIIKLMLSQCKALQVVGLVKSFSFIITDVQKEFPNLIVAVRETMQSNKVLYLDFKIFELCKQVPKLMDLLAVAPLVEAMFPNSAHE